MRTERLYRADAYAARFEALVLDAAAAPDGGARVVLDRTAFYPGGGGQPADRGTLGGAEVVALEEAGDGAVVHVLRAGPASAAPVGGARVSGEVDRDRRLDLMRHHSGQHLLSAAFRARLRAETASVHFSEDPARPCTLDVDRGALSEAEIEAVTDEALAIVLEDRPIAAAVHPLEDAPKLGLRKPPPAEQMVAAEGLRIVTIEGYDVSACCGTHVRRTGEIGPVRITGQEKTKGRTRLRFVVGPRAIRDERGTRRGLLEDIERAAGARRAAEKRAEALEVRLADRLAAEWAAAAPAAPALLVRRLDPEDPRPGAIANGLAARGRRAVVALQAAEGAQIVVARPADGAGDLAALAKAALAPLGAKGGGRPNFATFTLPPGASLDAALGALAAALAPATTNPE